FRIRDATTRGNKLRFQSPTASVVFGPPSCTIRPPGRPARWKIYVVAFCHNTFTGLFRASLARREEAPLIASHLFAEESHRRGRDGLSGQGVAFSDPRPLSGYWTDLFGGATQGRPFVRRTFSQEGADE